MGIREIIEKLRTRNIKAREFEEDRRVEQKWIDKQKSANERELERFMKEEREDSIKKELEEFRRKRQIESQYGNQILKTKNMFDPKINPTNTIINQRNLFSNKIQSERKLFFK